MAAGHHTQSREVNGIIEKECSTCGVFKILSEFYTKVGAKFNRYSKCIVCQNIHNKSNNITRRLRKHNITMEKYKELLEKGCVICGTKINLHMDHSHYHNKFRGILCLYCNTGIGSFSDNITLLLKAAAYLEEFNKSVENNEKTTV